MFTIVFVTIVIALGLMLLFDVFIFRYPRSTGRLPVKSARGIEVSHYHGKVKWRELRKAGVNFAYVKATQGTYWTDTCFKKTGNR